MGSGPGTPAGGEPQGEPGLATQTLMVSPVPFNVQLPRKLGEVTPKSAKVFPVNVALLAIGLPETYEG